MALSIFLVATILMFLTFYFKKKDIIDSLLLVFLLVSSIIVVVANILSLLNLYNRYSILVCWLLISFYLGYKLKGILKVANQRTLFSSPLIRFGVLESCAILLIVITVILSIVRAMTYPPENVDSLVYHLPRAFFYYKNGVNNIPSNYIVMNYTSPASEIILSHMFLLTEGSDLFVNLLQLSSYIVIILSMWKICVLLQINILCRFISLITVASLPIIILQSVTTQNDLLCTSFVFLCFYYYLNILQKEMLSQKDFFVFGICVGLAINTKITSATILFPLGIVLLFWMVKNRIKISCYVDVIFAIIILNVFYWYSNYVDLDGDFLAIKASSYMASDNNNFLEIIGRIIMSVIYCCGGRIRKINRFLPSLGRKLYNLVGASTFTDWNYYTISNNANHDIQPYGILFIIIVFSTLFVLFRRKNYRVFLIAPIIGMIISMASMPFKQSIVRYILPCMGLLSINVGIAFQNLKNQTAMKVAIVLLMIIMVSNVQFICKYDTAQPLFSQETYDEKKIKQYGSFSWDYTSKEFLQIIEKNEFTEIGIWEQNLCGIYPMLNAFKEDKYDVKSISGDYANNHIDKMFIPQAIVYVGNNEELPDVMEYNGYTYKKEREGNKLRWNNSQPGLYIR